MNYNDDAIAPSSDSTLCHDSWDDVQAKKQFHVGIGPYTKAARELTRNFMFVSGKK